MNINFARALGSALVALTASAFAHPSSAQQSRLSPKDVGQIVNEVLDAVIPPEQPLSRVRTATRGVFFDFGRTMAAFGHADGTVIAAELGLRREVAPGSRRLLSDCEFVATKPCSQLGWGVYVSIEPISVTISEASVWAHTYWPDRRSAAFKTGEAPSGRASLVGGSMQVHLTRGPDGTWKVVRLGPAIVS